MSRDAGLRYAEAAELLALKQSNLSRRVRHLEEKLGIALFERSNGGVRPTSAGQNFVSGVRRILDEPQIRSTSGLIVEVRQR